MNKDLKIGFITCVDFGEACLETICTEGFKISLAITLKDKLAPRKSGRAYIDDLCLRNDIPLLKVQHVNDKECLKALRSAKLDILFVIGWSQLLNQEIINTARIGVYGMHPTLLPEGRGRAALPWTILKQLSYSGVSLFRIEEEVDSGAVILQDRFNLQGDIDATLLYKLSKESHVKLMKKALPLFLEEEIKEIPQNYKNISYWPQRKPEDGLIDLEGSIMDAELLIRAVTRPYPGAYFFEGGKKITVWKSQIVSQREGKLKDQKYIDFKDGLLWLIEFEIE